MGSLEFLPVIAAEITEVVSYGNRWLIISLRDNLLQVWLQISKSKALNQYPMLRSRKVLKLLGGRVIEKLTQICSQWLSFIKAIHLCLEISQIMIYQLRELYLLEMMSLRMKQ